jgi:UDP-glucose 4-epimerase
MKVLVTGGAGFIGSHIVDAYVKDGHDVTVVDDLSKGRRENLNPRARFVRMDVRDPGLEGVFTASRFDAVNHHAAQIDVRRSVEDPLSDASINVLGTVRLLELSRAHGVRKFVFASSGGAVYGECPSRGAREEDAVRPLSPYGAGKAAAEHYVRVFGSCHGLPYTILRYANVYGPRQDPEGEAGVITIFIERMLSDRPVTIFGDGEQTRDYVHVGDVAEANRTALMKGDGRAFNIGTGRATSVNALFGMLAPMAGFSREPLRAPRRSGEVERSVLDASAAERHLGWRPALSLEEGLPGTLSFFLGRRGGLAPA